MYNQPYLLNYYKINAGKKIWSFYQYQNLLAEKIKEMIEELDSKIKTVLQLKNKTQEVGISNAQFLTVCTKAFEHKAGILKPLLLINSRNVKSNLAYFCDIISILHFSCQNEEINYIQHVMTNKERKSEQKQIYKILSLIFHLLSQQQEDLIRYQLLICLDSILKVLLRLSKQDANIEHQLKQFQPYCRIVSYKQSYTGISDFIKMVSSFDFQLIPNLTDAKINDTLDRILSHIDCVICYQPMTDPVSLKCGHSFCKDCINWGREYSKKCPICRFEQQDNLIFAENNQFLINLIQQRKEFEQDVNIEEEKEEVKSVKISLQELKNYQPLLLLETNSNLKMLVEQIVEINKKKFNTLQNKQIQRIFQNNPIFILYSLTSKEAFIAENKLANISKSKIIMIVEILEKVDIVETSEQMLQLNAEGEEEYLFNLQTAKAITSKDEDIDLQNLEVQDQLVQQINRIKQFFQQILNQQSSDETFQIVNTYLSKSGFLSLQSSDLIDKYDHMRKYSYLIPNILNIPEKERVQIQQQNNIFQRLSLLENTLKRFQNTTNILVLFKMQQLSLEKKNYWYILLFVLVFLLIVLYF